MSAPATSLHLGSTVRCSIAQNAARWWRVALRGAAAAGLLASASQAQLIGRYDIGSAGSPLAANHTQVTAATTFASTGAYGWLPGANLVELSRSTPSPSHLGNLPTELIQDSVKSATPFTFRQAVGTGTYACVVYLGDLGEPVPPLPTPPPPATPMYQMNVRANGVLVASDVFARLVRGRALTSNALGGYKRVAFLTRLVEPGNIDLEFFGASGAEVSVMGLEIYRYTAPPLSFSHATSSLNASASYAALLAPFTAAFGAHDYAGAKAALDALPSSTSNDLAKAWGYAWLQGWLTDAEADVDESVLASIEALLAAPTQPADSWPVVSLLADLRAFRRGELFTRTRGYSSTTLNPGNLGGILLNINAGAQLLEQLNDDVLDLGANSFWPDSPLFPKAAYLLARGMYGRNTTAQLGNQNGSFVPFNLQWLGILHKIWTRTDPGAVPASNRIFPKAVDAAVLAWYFETFVTQPAGPLTGWDGVSLPPTLAPNWFTPLTDGGVLPGHNPPNWARQQRHYARMMRNLGGWWMDRRLIEGELGGGGGDDVEAAAALSVPTVVKTEGSTHVFEAGVKAVHDRVLFGPDVDPSQGFVNPTSGGPCIPGVMDPEHAGEFTSYPLFFLMPTFFGDPRYVEYAMRTIRNFDEPPDPLCGDTSWTGFPSGSNPWSPWRHFKAFRLGAHGYEAYTGGASVDMATTELMKDIVPGFNLIDFNGSPTAIQLWYELAQGWAQVAMDTAPGYVTPKPAGIFPVGVRFSNGQMGENGQWWANTQQNGGYVGAYNYELYYMLLVAYRNASGQPVAIRNKLLEPIYRAVKLLSQVTPDANAPVGSEAWALAQMSGEIASIASVARAELESALSADPNMIDAVVSTYAPSYLQYLNAPALAGTAKDKSQLETLFGSASLWLEHFWPLATTTVAYTDRIRFLPPSVSAESAMLLLYSTMSGSQFSIAPTFPISWSQPASQLTTNDPFAIGSDVAILVNEVHGDVATPGDLALKVLLFNFGGGPIQLDMRVWRGLPTGNYVALLGDDTNFDDTIDSGPVQTYSLALTGRGDKLSLTNVLAGTLQVLDVVFLGPTTAPTPTVELGIGPEDITASGTTVTVEIHNLGTSDLPPSSGAMLRIFDDATNAPLVAAPLPGLLAPAGLNPSSVPVSMTLPAPLTPGQRLRARIVLPSSMTQITTLNDRAVRQF